MLTYALVILLYFYFIFSSLFKLSFVFDFIVIMLCFVSIKPVVHFGRRLVFTDIFVMQVPLISGK